jgi:hypothetical protein
LCHLASKALLGSSRMSSSMASWPVTAALLADLLDSCSSCVLGPHEAGHIAGDWFRLATMMLRWSTCRSHNLVHTRAHTRLWQGFQPQGNVWCSSSRDCCQCLSRHTKVVVLLGSRVDTLGEPCLRTSLKLTVNTISTRNCCAALVVSLPSSSISC